jgi:hypothetical protein
MENFETACFMDMVAYIGHVDRAWIVFGIVEKWNKDAMSSRMVYPMRKRDGVIAHFQIGG